MPELTDDEIDAKIDATTAPRVTKELIDSVIAGESYTRIGDTLTVCTLHLRNGFIVTGESACVDPENYRQDIGEAIACKMAYEKIWALEGYLLAEHKLNGTGPYSKPE